MSPKTVRSLRLRYIAGLSVIALLVTTSNYTMERVIPEHRFFSSLVNIAGHQECEKDVLKNCCFNDKAGSFLLDFLKDTFLKNSLRTFHHKGIYDLLICIPFK